MDLKRKYAELFEAERLNEYPRIDAFERACGCPAVDREEMERAARILACPIKDHPPNWQHGRVLYSAVRMVVDGWKARIVAFDCGTAKGFSALMIRRALDDAGVDGDVVSVDVIDPMKRLPDGKDKPRNTVAECDGPVNLFEILKPFDDAASIRFLKSTGIDWLLSYNSRVAVAFVDGKHDKPTVLKEGELLAERQQSGDLVVWDDVQLKPVAEAVALMQHAYHIEWVTCSPLRRYAVGRRK